MSRHRKDPLRPLTADERQELTRLSRSLSAPAAQVERSRALPSALGHCGWRELHGCRPPGRTTAHRDDLRLGQPLQPRRSRRRAAGHGGGPRIRYGADAQQRILAEWARTPQREQDGTAMLVGEGWM